MDCPNCQSELELVDPPLRMKCPHCGWTLPLEDEGSPIERLCGDVLRAGVAQLKELTKTAEDAA